MSISAKNDDGHLLSWPWSIDVVWLAMPLFVISVRALLQPIPPEDYWWHLAMGRLIGENGAIPDANLFLYSLPAEAPFYDQPWLAQWSMYAIFETFGHVGMLLANVLLLVGAWALLLWIGRRRRIQPIVLAISAALAHYLSAGTLTVRTQMFAYIPFVILLGVLFRMGEGEWRRGGALGLLLLTALWANLHGTFVWAPLLTGVMGAGLVLQSWSDEGKLDAREAGFWTALVAGLIAVTCVSPGGVDNLLYVLRLTGATHGDLAVVEWRPPGVSSLGHILFWIAAGLSAIWLFVRRHTLRLEESLLFLITGALAVSSVRAILWWAIVTVLVVGPTVTHVLPGPARRPGKMAGVMNAGICVFFVIGVALSLPGAPLFARVDPEPLYGHARLDVAGLTPLSERSPVPLVEELGENGYRGRLFHDQAVAGLLEFELTSASAPERVVFVDQRIELVPAKVWDDYFTMSRATKGWWEIARGYGIKTYLLHPQDQARLIEELEASPEFHRRDEFRDHVLYVEKPDAGR